MTPHIEPRPELKLEFPLDYIWVESGIIFLSLSFLSFIVASSHENSKIVSPRDDILIIITASQSVSLQPGAEMHLESHG